MHFTILCSSAHRPPPAAPTSRRPLNGYRSWLIVNWCILPWRRKLWMQLCRLVSASPRRQLLFFMDSQYLLEFVFTSLSNAHMEQRSYWLIAHCYASCAGGWAYGGSLPRAFTTSGRGSQSTAHSSLVSNTWYMEHRKPSTSLLRRLDRGHYYHLAAAGHLLTDHQSDWVTLTYHCVCDNTLLTSSRRGNSWRVNAVSIACPLYCTSLRQWKMWQLIEQSRGSYESNSL